MPTYEYSCGACGHEFEMSQRISDPPIRTCVKCKKDRAVRQISRPSFILKGGGWYADGYSRRASTTTQTGQETGASRDAAGRE
jgi:putative FmdB family regulatory protein